MALEPCPSCMPGSEQTTTRNPTTHAVRATETRGHAPLLLRTHDTAHAGHGGGCEGELVEVVRLVQVAMEGGASAHGQAQANVLIGAATGAKTIQGRHNKQTGTNVNDRSHKRGQETGVKTRVGATKHGSRRVARYLTVWKQGERWERGRGEEGGALSLDSLVSVLLWWRLPCTPCSGHRQRVMPTTATAPRAYSCSPRAQKQSDED
jgi:hypothetical protein